MNNKLKKILAVLIMGVLMAPQAFAETKGLTLEERVAELEANSSLNIFSFSGAFQTRFDDIMKAKQTDPAMVLGQPAAFDNKDLTYLRMKFQFNINANISKNIKFYSRLTADKHFNTFVTSGGPSTTSGAQLTSGNDYANPGVVLEKAYADFIIPDSNFVLSLGRLPTVDGQPQNYKDGRARMGTYPMLSYDTTLDGFALTYKVDEYLPKDNKLALRLIYTPFSQYNLGSSGYTSSATQQTGAKLDTQVSTYAVQVDYLLDNMSWTDNMGVVLQNFQTGDLYYNSAAPGSTGPSSLNIAVGGATLAVEMNGIAYTPWDLSLSYLASSVKSSGAMGLLGVGFDTNSSTSDTMTGGVFLLSTRYKLASWILGAEYLNGSKNGFYYAGNEEDLTNFYSTRGDAYHLYVTKKFTQNLSLRLGYMDQKYKWTSPALGAPVSSDRVIQTGYANLRLDF